MFIWYWTSYGIPSIDDACLAWTDEEYVGLCIVKPSDCCMMVPPDSWECE